MDFVYFHQGARLTTRNKLRILILICCIIALVIMMHQWIIYPGHWFDFLQIMHHEDFALDALFVGLGIGISLLIIRENQE